MCFEQFFFTYDEVQVQFKNLLTVFIKERLREKEGENYFGKYCLRYNFCFARHMYNEALMPQFDPDAKLDFIKKCKMYLNIIIDNVPLEPKLIAECQRINQELDKDPVPYGLFKHKESNCLFD